ncbi:MAG TPA: DUF4388 domain-containing protein, partial [Thermoanaerobaculia bacterium]|nr:DUF4388 domain-containing protein [Thermoanaerobaculia bacterium]
KAAVESEELRKERDKSRQEIEKLSKEGERFRASAQRADQLGPANEDLRKENEALRRDLRKKEGVEESLRDAIQQLRVTDEELMNELKVLTDALRKEIDRRRGAEYELQEAESELARTSTEWQARLEALVQTRAGDERERAGEEDISAALSPDRPWKEFDAIGPIELLIEMSQGERSGTLFIVSGKIEKKIHFAFGKIYSCASNVPSLFLAEILIADGTITQEQRNRAVDISRESGIALGRILVIMGAVTEAQLVESMHRKIEKEVAGVLAFSEGRSLFVEGEMPLVQMIPLRVEVIPLIEALLARPPVLEYVQPETLVEGPSEVLEDESIDSTAEANAIKEGEQPESAVPSYEDLDEGPAPAELHASEARTDSSDSAAAADPATDLAIEEVPNDAVVGSKSGKSKKYHRPGCKNASRIAPASRVSFDSPAAAESAGFDRCKICFGK